ncbi:MAG: lysophospholipid acyltransferase family protein [Lentisphaeria bacterium]
MEIQITPPEYHTPADRQRSLKHRLLPGASPQFLWDTLVGSVLWGRHLALHGKFSDPEMSAGAEKVMRAVEASGAKIHVTGLQALAETEGALVIAGNHMSTLETLIMPRIIYPFKECSFVVKKSLVTGKIFGPIMRELQPVAVGRHNPRDDLKTVLTEGTALLKKGRSVCIFPQTTRSQDFVASDFNSLGAKLAKRAGVKLVPLAIKTDFWVPGKLVRDFGRVYPGRDVHLAFGPVIDCSTNARDAHKQTLDFIAAKTAEWGVRQS